MTLTIFEDLDEARQTVLRRRDTWVLEQVPEPVRAGIRRAFGQDMTPEQGVAAILRDVRERGDEALREWSDRLDGNTAAISTTEGFEVPFTAWERAYAALPADLANALDLAAERIRSFHARQPIPSWETDEMGGTLGQRVTPLQRVGVYVPGGTAPLPSSLLMSAIPARVAGVDEVIVCTPPDRTIGQV
ncbi:MAG: histidinol dehydrogenase, partial [Anaerolineae bacterium]